MLRTCSRILCTALLLAFASCVCSAGEELHTAFRNPPPGYGPVPLWWWDGEKLEHERLAWQLDQLKAQGVMSPCVIYLAPRRADPPYFSEQWWDTWNWVVKECRRRGMTIWFYDQVGFGGAGWQADIARRHPELRGGRLECIAHKVKGGRAVRLAAPAGTSVVGAAAYPIQKGAADAGGVVGLNDIVREAALEWNAPDGDWLLALTVSRPASLDPMNPKATAVLIDELYAEYERRCPDELGKTIVGSFQDELNLWQMPPWSDGVPAEFKRRKGYDLLPLLPALWHDIGPLTPKVRVDYFDVVVALAEESFFKPIYDWHEERGLLVTHDNWGRLSLQRQTTAYGDYYRTMRWFQGPGYDDAGVTAVGQRNFRDAKLSSSIAHMYRRPRVWCEAFHSSGWGLTTEQMVAWTNENYAYGANIYDKHGLYYTTYGGWWEWAPPSAHFRQPYWMHYGEFSRYLCRLSYILSRGVHCCDVAVLYPAVELQAGLSAGGGFCAEAKRCEHDTFELARYLFREAIDMDYVDDESILRAEVNGGELRVAGESYRVLILPSITTLRRSAVEKALAFQRSGGLVIAYGCLPRHSAEAGRDDSELAAAVKQLFSISSQEAEKGRQPVACESTNGGAALFMPKDYAEVKAAIDRRIDRDFLPSGKDVYVLHRRIGDADAYFVFNVRGETNELQARFRVAGSPSIWDAWTGAARPVHRFTNEGAHTVVRLRLAPYEGQLLVFNANEKRLGATSDNLAEVSDIEADADRPSVSGSCRTAGEKTATVVHGDKAWLLKGTAEEPPEPLLLNGPWEFELSPTVDNRWGDFRLPPSAGLMGPEVRRFKYAEENGQQADWHKAELDDSKWQQVTCSFGPCFLALGPLPPGTDTSQIEKQLLADPEAPVRVGGKQLEWRRCRFSKRWGIEHDHVHWRSLGPKKTVPDEFIDLGVHAPGSVWYLRTCMRSERATQTGFLFGARAPRDAWLNGNRIVSHSKTQGYQEHAEVSLRAGENRLLLKLTHNSREHLRAYAVLGRNLSASFSHMANWIWFPADAEDVTERYFRKAFDVKRKPKRAALRITCDNSYEARLNGSFIGRDEGADTVIWKTVEEYDVSGLIRDGRNAIAIRARNLGGPGGLIAELTLGPDSDAPIRISTDASWRCSKDAVREWMSRELDDAAWATAERIAPAGGGVWGEQGPLQLVGEPSADRVCLRWFAKSDGLEHDVMPSRKEPVAWYRFKTPPGLRGMQVSIRGRLLGAWIDGAEVKVPDVALKDGLRSYTLRPGGPVPSPAVVSLRVRQQPGAYEGAAIPDPVILECGKGKAHAAPWNEIGLSCYSGAAVYRRDVRLGERYAGKRVFLDLGRVSTTAELRVNGRSAGVRIAPPWRFEITDFVRPGTNRIEILLTNTLANHFSIGYPTPYIHRGQTHCGLFGPVRVEAMTNVKLHAAGQQDR